MQRISFGLILCVLMFAFTAAAAADTLPAASPDLIPETDDSGFLPEGSDAWYYANHAEGSWIYVSDTVRLTITRIQTKEPLLTYYIADIVCRSGTSLKTATWNTERPGRTNGLPQDIARRDHLVYAQNADFYSYRIANNKYPGAIVREGKVLYSKTATRKWDRVPDLATMAFYPSGMTEINQAWEVSAKEYVSRGAETVVAFGPILIRNGEMADLSGKECRHYEPRSCMGVIDPGHYVGLLVEGRNGHSSGAYLSTCAEILLDYGCWDAINLDGGGTAAMLFMGESVQLTDNGGVHENQRSVPDLLYVGTY